ncbi:glycosyltransferase [Sphingomonas oligophenolica]|uniref:Glycosyltransferase n=1 Tax=Sphingomonas oligophenolica TaxID=301154 RepID=A0ABU9YBZ2_9SPHN
MTGKMSLGIVTASLSPEAGGMFEAVQAPANLLQQRGHNVSVYGIDDTELPAALDSWRVKRFRSFASKGPARLAYAPEMGKLLVTKRYDVLHLHGLWNYPSYAASRWNRERCGKLVISPHGMLDPWALRNGALKKRLAGWLYENANLRSAGALRALCSAEADAIAALGLKVPIAIIPNGVTLPDLDTLPPPSPKNRKTLLFLGRIHPKKGIADLIRAWTIAVKQLPALHDDWQLEIAGWDDGDHLPRLVTLARESGLANISFRGPLYGAAKDEALAGCDAFILPSRSEGMPMSVLEAWAYRKPVLMTAACNIPEGFAAGAAFPVEHEPKALAASLIELLDQSEALAEAGRRGRQLVEEQFTWDRITDQHAALFAWLTGRGSTPDFVVR